MNAPAPVVIKYRGSGDSAVNANHMLPCCWPVSFLRTTRSSWQLWPWKGGLCQHTTKRRPNKGPAALIRHKWNSIRDWKRKLEWMGCLVSCVVVWFLEVEGGFRAVRINKCQQKSSAGFWFQVNETSRFVRLSHMYNPLYKVLLSTSLMIGL